VSASRFFAAGDKVAVNPELRFIYVKHNSRFCERRRSVSRNYRSREWSVPVSQFTSQVPSCNATNGHTSLDKVRPPVLSRSRLRSSVAKL
jgi:hypothetical protein